MCVAGVDRIQPGPPTCIHELAQNTYPKGQGLIGAQLGTCRGLGAKRRTIQDDLHGQSGQREGERHQKLLYAAGTRISGAKKDRMNPVSNKTSLRQDRSKGLADSTPAAN